MSTVSFSSYTGSKLGMTSYSVFLLNHKIQKFPQLVEFTVIKKRFFCKAIYVTIFQKRVEKLWVVFNMSHSHWRLTGLAEICIISFRKLRPKKRYLCNHCLCQPIVNIFTDSLVYLSKKGTVQTFLQSECAIKNNL